MIEAKSRIKRRITVPPIYVIICSVGAESTMGASLVSISPATAIKKGGTNYVQLLPSCFSADAHATQIDAFETELKCRRIFAEAEVELFWRDKARVGDHRVQV